MAKKKGIAIAAVLTFLIGFIISVQISTTAGDDQGALVPLAKLKGYEARLTQATEEKEAALEQLKTLEEQLASIQRDKAGESDSIRTMVEENQKNKIAAGLTDVYGPGLRIVIKDPPVEASEENETFSLIAYNYEYLLNVVNKLKEAGAEAISINGERIVQTTEISLAGDNININGKATAQPYTIDAIGPGDTMEAAVTIRAGVVEAMKNLGLVVSTEKKERIEMTRYSGVMDFQYARPEED
ncbi:DUF881 domain-containing protein [bacterium 210820-DFI.6.37]|nr:DUF881 domain-containing protein [bacterium 210820-DFI.6.37]